jgi:cytoskeletal protein CcmA (bactofilin family)
MSGVRNFLSADVQVKGEIMFVGELQIDGKLEGSVLSDGNLFVGDRALVQGDAHVGNAIVAGKVKGNVIAAGKVELKAGAELMGDIAAPRLAMDEGATFVGRIDVNPGRGQPQATARPAQAAQPQPAVPAVPVAAARPAEPIMIGGGNGPKVITLHR